jgi:hypothetical protein
MCLPDVVKRVDLLVTQGSCIGYADLSLDGQSLISL